MLLFAGLGNPGSEYAGNRHNIGFIALDAIAHQFGFPPWRKQHHGLVTKGRMDAHQVFLLKPMTFMNRSGISVGDAAHFYKIPPQDVVVFHDEIDLEAGKIRTKTGGGTAGHNGLKSIGAHYSSDFRRVRIGIGHPGDREKVHDHVLRDFSWNDREWVEPLVHAIAQAASHLAAGDAAGFTNAIALTRGNGA